MRLRLLDDAQRQYENEQRAKEMAKIEAEKSIIEGENK